MSDWKQTIEDAKRLLDMGAITQDQFEQIRDNALKNLSQPSSDSSRIPSIDELRTIVNKENNLSVPPPSLVDEMETLVGTVGGETIGNYIIRERLGEGGMGVVYRARHKNEQFAKGTGDVAIKMIRPSYAQDHDFRTRFIREAILGKRLAHSNIAKVIDVYDDKGLLALLMEYVEGQELKELIPKDGMPAEEVINLLKPVASALDYLHAEGIVHRDMKPANVRVKPDGTSVILDFGIAKDTNEADSGMTQTGTAMGTQTYMAPEQMDAKRVTGAADQYALAMMAYQMLSGRLPWNEDVSQARLGLIKLTSDYQTLIAVCSVSEPQNYAVMKGLSLQPEDRYETCVVFVETLDGALSVEQLGEESRLVEEAQLSEEQEKPVRHRAERILSTSEVIDIDEIMDVDELVENINLLGASEDFDNRRSVTNQPTSSYNVLDSEENSFDEVQKIDDFISPMWVSSVRENYNVDSSSKTKPPNKKPSLDWKPIVGTIVVVCVAIILLMPKQKDVVEEEPSKKQHEFAVPEVQTGALVELANLEETKNVRKTKTMQPAKPQTVDESGVRTFQTAPPVGMGRTMPTTDSATGQSDNLERSVAKLKKSMKYCHTKALKTDPTVSGKWEVTFKVASGSASNIKIKTMRSSNTDIETCMQMKIKRFNFSDSSTVQNFKFRMLFER